jgi:hypothetical protein
MMTLGFNGIISLAWHLYPQTAHHPVFSLL